MASPDRPPHKRSKSAIARSLLHRVTSRNEDAPPVPGTDDIITMDAGNASNYSTPRKSTSHRPHLSTSMSGYRQEDTSTSDEPPSASSITQGATIEQSVKLFKIFEALRHGDTAAISKILQADGGAGLEGTTALHLAIQCANDTTVEYVLAQHAVGINSRDKDGNTALHLASQLGRAPVVKLLLDQAGVNDSVVNYNGKTPLDLARNPDIFQMLQLSKSMYIDQIVRSIHQLIAKSDYDGLEQILTDARTRTTIDVNAPELATETETVNTGGALLHEAARKHDLKLAQILLLNGADPFRRDRKGKLPQDVTKDEKTRAILKKSPAAAVAQRSIQEKSILGDSSVSLPSAEGGPGGKESREMKGYLRKWTNYTSGFKLRWFVLEDGVLSYYKHQEDTGSACRGAINMKIARLKMDPKDKLVFEILGKSSVKYNLKANHEVEAKRWFWALNNAIQWAKDEEKTELKRQQQENSALHHAREEQLERQRTRESELATTGSHLIPATAVALAGSVGASAHDTGSLYEPSVIGDDIIGSAKAHSRAGTIEGDLDDDEEYGDDLSTREARPVNRDAFSITAQSAKLQLELLEQISIALKSEGTKQPNLAISDATVVQALSSYEIAVGNLKGLLLDLLRISRDHEAYWQAKLEREVTVRRLWEDSMARVAREQEELESRIGESEYKRKQAKRALREVLDTQVETESDLVSSPGPVEGTIQRRSTVDLSSEAMRRRRETIASITKRDIFEDEDDDDEFFDAVDAGEVEVVAAMPPKSPPITAIDEKEAPAIVVDTIEPENALEQDIAKSYKGYEDGIRERLKLDADNRPKVSLWAILKSMIGKDMTKMTLPVTFNEPTSLLYRVVEDMEYTELLNVAAQRTDSMERLVYVAAFAASEYASTIGRVAKPFNPLLGETYEYVRPDLGYRFFIEQVSHHPPVGAAYAEGKNWTYEGESSVKSKFYGKSFEFNPLGTWFLTLRPTDGGPPELYTWKKVTSSVVGIITGSPSVDQSGLMQIKNWNTGEVAELNFVPKGWKASSAYQVTGKAMGKDGRTIWSIGGRWNSKLYARLTPGYEVELSGENATASDKAILIWTAHDRPAGIPFNLTPFAVTLNALPDRLKPLVAPTDTRLRPDQRAMEEGEYDFAADEKIRLEEAQRARRRVRETKGEEFDPHWFTKAKHPVTGDEYYEFSHEYWKIRDGVANGITSWDDQGLEKIY